MKNILVVLILVASFGCSKKNEPERYETTRMTRHTFYLKDHGNMQIFSPSVIRGATSEDDGATWHGSGGFAEGLYSHNLEVCQAPADLDSAARAAVDSMSELVEKTALPDGFLVVAVNKGAKQYEVHAYRKTTTSAWSHCEVSMMGDTALPNQAVLEKMKQECLSLASAE